jgi:hypothetical protein
MGMTDAERHAFAAGMREMREMAANKVQARRFHELYEELAPEFGYQTRKESAVPWEQVPEANRNLMMSVCLRIQEDIRAIEIKDDSTTEGGELMCHANRDGDCSWKDCPQLRDGEPKKTGRHCPFDTEGGEWLQEGKVKP